MLLAMKKSSRGLLESNIASIPARHYALPLMVHPPLRPATNALRTMMVPPLLLLLAGCVAPVSQIVSRISADTGREFALKAEPAEAVMPPGVSLADGLTEDEAVSMALWNNAAFQEALTEIGFTRADLIQAGQLSNPTLTVLFPYGPKQLEFTAKLPLEVLWLRPKRVAVAKADAERVAKMLAQTGLNLVRDVRLACTEVELAQNRLRATRDSAEAFGELQGIAQGRVAAGDGLEFEVTQARVDAQRARSEVTSRLQDEIIARERLASLIGLGVNRISWKLRPLPPIPPIRKSPAELVKEALAARPELRAAELAIEAAGQRSGLAVAEIFTLSGTLDANRPPGGIEMGPGVDLAIPILNQNNGARALAHAKVAQAARHYIVVRDRIALEVREAHARVVQARGQLESWRSGLVPAMRTAVQQARKIHELGELPAQLSLDAEQKLAAGRLSEADALAALRRAQAELDRAIGRRLDHSPKL